MNVKKIATVFALMIGLQVSSATACEPCQVEWIGNTWHYPLNGEIDAWEDVWVHTDLWKVPFSNNLYRTQSLTVMTHFTTDDWQTWDTVYMSEGDIIGDTQQFYGNLGSFPSGTQVKYVTAVWEYYAGFGHNEFYYQTVWDNNNQQDHIAQVNVTSDPVYWIGNVGTFPVGPVIPKGHELWIDIESWPIGSAVGGYIVYQINNGPWQAAPLKSNGTANNNDKWHVNLWKFDGGESIRYALVIEDGLGNQTWENNNGQDFYLTVSP